MKIQLCIKWFVSLGLSLNFHAVAASVQPVSSLDPALGISAGGSGDSCAPIVSPDGRFVVFASTANNLLLATNNRPMSAPFPSRFNVFLRDCLNDSTTLVSANLTGVSGGNGDSIPADLSTNGQFILFESSADDLVANDTNNFADIFVRDLQSSTNTRVSISTTAGNANGASRGAVMTPDGRYIAFVSSANNLVNNDTNGISDVFVRDLQSGTTTLASAGATSVNSSSTSEAPEISANGRYVAFYSTATNLISGVSTSTEIYVRDLVGNTTIHASTAARTALLSVTGNSNAVSSNHAISSDGKFVVYAASNTASQTNGLILRYSMATGLTDLVHTNAIMSTGNREDLRTLDITPDGRFIAFLANTKTNVGGGTLPSVVVWDAQTSIATVASRNSTNGVAFGTFDFPSIDSTGRYVSFISTATNLTSTSVSGFHVYVRDLQLSQTTLMDLGTNGAGSDLVSFVIPRLSANGHFIAFGSFDPLLAAQNLKRNYHLYLRDISTNTIEVISAVHPGLASFTPNGTSPFSSWSVNGNGRYVAFASDASNIGTNDTNLNRDIFVRDLLNQTTILASAGANGVSAAGMSFEPSISSDGRFVAFTSTATNLFSLDNNKARDVFVCNLQTRNIVLASVTANGTSVGNGSSYAPVISEDGRYVFFSSKASNLAAGSFVSGSENLFYRDLVSSNTVALTTAGLTNAAITPDGRYAAFRANGSSILYIWDSFAKARIYTNSSFNGIVASLSKDGVRLAYTLAGQLQVFDRVANQTWSIGAVTTTSRAGIKFSGNGRFLTFASSSTQGFTDANGTFDVYLYDLSTSTKTLVSHAHGFQNAASSASDSPDISFDGRFVAYRSSATNLVANDANGWPDVFVYDRLTGTNTLRSGNWFSDSSGNNRSMAPAFSKDGKTLLFPSWASDLIANDFNQSSDLFAFAFLYITVTHQAGQPPLISWSAIPGQTYQVQFKNNVDDPDWSPVTGTVVITENQASIQDLLPEAEHRIYRVLAF